MDAAVEVPVLEVFSTFQGEGPHVGERQIFVRLAKCDLRCAFCDTPDSFPTPDTARVQVRIPDGDEHVPNPMSVERLVDAVAHLHAMAGEQHTAVSITGGEPLLHPDAVGALARGVHGLEMPLRVHVETGGHRPKELAGVLDAVDEVSPDLKLESATGTPTPWAKHEESYALLEAAGKALCVKAVIGDTTTVAELVEAAAFAWRHLPSAPLVLQPATPYGEGPGTPSRAQLYALFGAAAAAHPSVRVIPQVHRFLGLR